MKKFNQFSKTTISINSSKVFIFTIYLILILGSIFLFYKGYHNYSFLNNIEKQHKVLESVNDISLRKEEQRVIMMTSVMVLTLSLLMLSRRKYLLKYMKLENKNLQRLLDDLEGYQDQEKVEEFKRMIKNKNFSEIYELMSEMIHQLHLNQELANDANKTKSLFLANMSHEIRTPLNGIVGFTKFLSSTNLDEEQKEFVKIIRKSSEDLLSIINDILDISKIENGCISLEEVYFNPMEEFENVIESYAANASKKDIDFSLWIDPIFSSILLRSDPGKIKQVLINLISNAVKFTDNKGTIDVIIEAVSTLDENITVKFIVKDTGVGISKEQEDKVFEAFTQADISTSRKYGGTGLGLTISAGLVNALGGALKVESRLGEGSSFYFVLEMPKKDIERKSVIKPMKVAIYTPQEVRTKDSDHYLEDYLLSFAHLSIMRFKTFKECILATSSMFDALYIHYDKINQEELEQIVEHHGTNSNIILVTKLNKHNLIQKISAKFAQVLYEPITFSKVEKSFNQLIEYKDRSVITKNITVNPPVNTKQLFSNIHALVVEDNPINQKMIQHTLKNIGITTECANNGREGLSMYMKNSDKYDIVFMDIQMPVMNGIEATKAIIAFEQSKNLAHTPIVAVTANALKGDREHFMAEGVDEYVSKPINLEKFIGVLKLFFQESNSIVIPKVSKRDILLYKETPMEAKIISAILEKLDYSVDVVENLDELKKVMDVNSYKCILLDRVNSEVAHSNVSQYIKAQNIPSMLFVDGKAVVVPSDKENFTFISDKVADYSSIKEKVDKMIELSKAS